MDLSKIWDGFPYCIVNCHLKEKSLKHSPQAGELHLVLLGILSCQAHIVLTTMAEKI